MNKGRKGRQRSGHALRSIVLAMMLSFAFVIQASAANPYSFLQGYYVQDDSLVVHCASLTDLGGKFEPQQFAATISGKECPVLDVTTVEEVGEGVTFYCLVDVSGSMHREQMETAKEVLSAICEGLGQQDNMVVGALGTTLETGGFLTDREEIQNEIDALTAGSDYTAIYDAVTDSVAVLLSSKECNRKKCLVIISDGDDETIIGKTHDDARRAIENSGIPVYTVATLRQSHTEQQRESAKKLGVFARQSAGGMDLVPAVNDYSAEEAGGFILEDMHGGLVLTLGVPQVDFSRDEALLTICLESDSAVYSDDLYVYTADLSGLPGREEALSPEEGGETSEEQPSDGLGEAESGPGTSDNREPESGPGTSDNKEPESGPGTSNNKEPESGPGISDNTESDVSGADRLLLYAGILAGVVVILVVCALLVGKNRKKRKEEERQQGEQERRQKEQQEQERRQKEQQKQERQQREQEEQKRQGERDEQEEHMRRTGSMEKPSGLIGFQTVGAPTEVCYEVKFIAIDHEDIVFTLKLSEGKAVTIGRNNKADMVLNPDDQHLSAVQCKLCCRQGAMNVWDMDSRNDTFVNGVPIRKIGMVTVQNGDVMRLGSYEYRVFLKCSF